MLLARLEELVGGNLGMKKYRDEDWLRSQYKKEEKLQREIAKECGVQISTISNWMKKYGIETRERMTEEEARSNPLHWSSDIAYLTGLVTSDGTIKSNRPRIQWCNKDKTLMEQAKSIADENNIAGDCKIFESIRMGSSYWQYEFTSRRYRNFLENIGIHPNKSKTIGALDIPDNMFFDWLRGEIDGDGCWYRNKNGNLSIQISSGSDIFLVWLAKQIKGYLELMGKGNVNKHNGAYNIRFFHQDSVEIASKVYSNAEYYLRRKYDIVKEFI